MQNRRFVMTKQDEVTKAVNDLEKIEEEARKTETLLKGLQSSASEQHKRIQTLILGGGTTGDAILDYLFLRGYGASKEQQACLKSVNDALKGKTGELVAIFRYYDRRMYGPHDETRTEVQFYLAVLRGDTLRFTQSERPECALPIDSYALCSNDHDRSESSGIIRKPFTEDFTGHFEVLKDTGRTKEHPSSKLAIAIVAGTEAVRALFSYEYLSLGEKGKKKVKDLEKDLGLFELEAQTSE